MVVSLFAFEDETQYGEALSIFASFLDVSRVFVYPGSAGRR
jgi:hypothetical protein